MRALAIFFSAILLLPAAAMAQGAAPLFRVYLTDGSALSSYGEWARVGDRVVFSLPVIAGAESSQLHLVSVAADRIDWSRTEDYARAVRAANYASHRGAEDFARLSADVARTVNEIALVKDPAERLVLAERARRSLADWSDTHYGYRAKDVNEMIATLDEVVGDLRALAGLARFDLTLVANTATPPPPALLPAPEQAEIVQQLVTASNLAATPAERVSLLQTVIGILDRTVDLLPATLAATIRSSALGAIAEERRTDGAYARLRETTLVTAAKYAARADVRSLERLRHAVQEQDRKLGQRRADELASLTAAIESHIAAAQRFRLTYDQWIVRAERLRAYQRTTNASMTVLMQAQRRLDDIKALAGPAPGILRPLIENLARERRVLSRIDPPADLAGIHALLRSASELAHNAATLRLDAIEAADLEIARRASAAAAGAIMLLSRARADLDAALRPPVLAAAAQ